MAACCGLTRPAKAAGGCRRGSPTSTRVSSTCCSPMRTSAFASIAASTRWRSRAQRFSLSASGRIRSGGSTLTMQVARLLEPRSGRNISNKLRQVVRAVEIERALTKDEILALYLDLAPYGGNIEGVRAASLAYFGKEPRRLSLGEAALLVALPQSPEARRPDRSAAGARAARDRVLDRFAASGRVPADEIALAKAEPVPAGRRPMPMLAPHAADRAVAGAPPGSEVRLTIDADMQKKPRGACARTRPHAGADAWPRYLARDARRRQRDRRGAGACRLAGLFRCAPRRPGRHDPGAAFTRLDVEALHLRAGI